MKKEFSVIKFILALFAAVLLFSAIASAQTSVKSRKLPPFRIMQANGKLYKAENLPVGKPILLVYFSPDCDHCQKLMNEFFKSAEDFKKASIVMITYLPVDRVAQFNKEYEVQRFSNLVVGTEGMTFLVRNYYNLMEMPFAALHDKDGNLVKSYTRNVPLKELSNSLYQLK
ncbi:redoxin domain-containing protein [Chitinophagaceae bacterium LB-8]|uniref:Redoxin domain-containing protein n=1 Tax=Paraflavisolibacter caeni TaxID=2982496 RepID=A0A9X2XNN6_9BACT|nr:redoxin domain-containing protein [Paraflavisolibacter caeni]MCU7548699.1 redoxin domain-containing protein [Paraflavisolibacter caeni]